MIDPIFLDWYMKGPTFLMYPGTCTYLSFRNFMRLLFLFILDELTAIFVYFYRPGIWMGYVSKYWLKNPYHNYSQVTHPLQVTSNWHVNIHLSHWKLLCESKEFAPFHTAPPNTHTSSWGRFQVLGSQLPVYKNVYKNCLPSQNCRIIFQMYPFPLKYFNYLFILYLYCCTTELQIFGFLDKYFSYFSMKTYIVGTH